MTRKQTLPIAQKDRFEFQGDHSPLARAEEDCGPMTYESQRQQSLRSAHTVSPKYKRMISCHQTHVLKPQREI